MSSFEIDIDPRLGVKPRTVQGSSSPLPQLVRRTDPTAAAAAAYATRTAQPVASSTVSSRPQTKEEVFSNYVQKLDCSDLTTASNKIEKYYLDQAQLNKTPNPQHRSDHGIYKNVMESKQCNHTPTWNTVYKEVSKSASTPQNLPGAFGAVETRFRQDGGRRRSKKSSKKHLKRSSKKHSKKHSKKSSKKHLKRSSKKHSKKHSKKSSKKHGKKY